MRELLTDILTSLRKYNSKVMWNKVGDLLEGHINAGVVEGDTVQIILDHIREFDVEITILVLNYYIKNLNKPVETL